MIHASKQLYSIHALYWEGKILLIIIPQLSTACHNIHMAIKIRHKVLLPCNSLQELCIVMLLFDLEVSMEKE